MDAAQELSTLQVREIATDRLGRNAMAARQVTDVDRTLLEGKHVDRSLAIDLESRPVGRGGHYRALPVRLGPTVNSTAAIGPISAIRR